MPPHNLRRIYITDLLLRDTTIAVRESAANAMGHSTKTQESVYNRASQRQSVSLILKDSEDQIEARKEARAGAAEAYNTSSATPKSLGKKKRVDTDVGLEEEIEYEVRDIRDVRPKTTNGVNVEFKCVWERYPSDEYTWEPPKNFVSLAAQDMCMGYINQADANGTWSTKWCKPIFAPTKT